MVSKRIETPKHLSNMERLAKWIRIIRYKKQSCYRRSKRNLRIEAVLTHALSRAENEFHRKQLKRITRGNKTMEDLMSMEYGSCCELYNMAKKKEDQDTTKVNPWQGPLCPELSSLDDFMLEVNQIKSPVQR